MGFEEHSLGQDLSGKQSGSGSDLDINQLSCMAWPMQAPKHSQRVQNMHDMMKRIDLMLQGTKEFDRFLACHGRSAQWLLDYLQDLLDCTSPGNRGRLFDALLLVSSNTNLHPSCRALSNLEHPKLVDGGRFSDVYRGVVCGQPVAVKVMRIFEESDIAEVLKVFGREALTWRQLSHPNILPFYGLYTYNQKLCLVSPWMDNGHVRDFLKNSGWNIDHVHSLILDVALGLEYLHKNGIVHGELIGDNILITSSGRACIADFGISPMCSLISSIQLTHASTGPPGGYAYDAPELILGEPRDFRSDIYSFACTAYEMLAGTRPFSTFKADAPLIRAVLAGQRPSHPALCLLDGLWNLLGDCWAELPNNRPNASQIIQRLKDIGIVATETQSSIQDWKVPSDFHCQLRDQIPLPLDSQFEDMFFGHEGGLATMPKSPDPGKKEIQDAQAQYSSQECNHEPRVHFCSADNSTQ
ncbi:kinase-like domain-containing protein [Roridomyces roridus]|uniref:Kinase-like domain-containing protein n=1 Tax=Roridomyces roridus TaxID=1738132 RepID=A0AAD7CKS4_9AGAR|nr:kinase-like domain-containing protein [Roridomyces roridus]